MAYWFGVLRFAVRLPFDQAVWEATVAPFNGVCHFPSPIVVGFILAALLIVGDQWPRIRWVAVLVGYLGLAIYWAFLACANALVADVIYCLFSAGGS